MIHVICQNTILYVALLPPSIKASSLDAKIICNCSLYISVRLFSDLDDWLSVCLGVQAQRQTELPEWLSTKPIWRRTVRWISIKWYVSSEYIKAYISFSLSYTLIILCIL
jgi:hypothetical protein